MKEWANSVSGLVALARPKEIQNRRKLRCKLLQWPFTFLNYTKMAKYEALEKNAVSEPKIPQLGHLQYSLTCRKAPLCWEIFDLFIGGEIRGPEVVAEGKGFELAVRSFGAW